jgi:hypothetical protein
VLLLASNLGQPSDHHGRAVVNIKIVVRRALVLFIFCCFISISHIEALAELPKKPVNSPLEETEVKSSAGVLISQAHEFDGYYAGMAHRDHVKALNFYNDALAAHPTASQRFHILDRIGWLNTTGYISKLGEKPNHKLAMKAFEEIAANFSMNDPNVMKDVLAAADSHLALREWATALEGYRRIINYHVSLSLQDDVYTQLRKLQLIAIDQAGGVAYQLSPELFEAEMQSIMQLHPNTPLASRAREKTERYLQRKFETNALPPEFDQVLKKTTDTTKFTNIVMASGWPTLCVMSVVLIIPILGMSAWAFRRFSLIEIFKRRRHISRAKG